METYATMRLYKGIPIYSKEATVEQSHIQREERQNPTDSSEQLLRISIGLA